MAYRSEKRKLYEELLWKYSGTYDWVTLPFGKTICSISDDDLYHIIKEFLPAGQDIPFEIAELGVAHWPCTRDDITRAWRKKAQRIHPDKGGDHTAFVKTKEKYDQAINNYDAGKYFQKKTPSIQTTREAGDYGERLFWEELSRLKGKSINSFMRTGNLKCHGMNFQLDALVFVDRVGLVLVEVKYYSGTLYANSGLDTWIQVLPNDRLANPKNPWKQVLRAKDLLGKMLQYYLDCATWPIIPLVVLAHPQCSIIHLGSDPLFVSNVIKLENFEAWLSEQSLSQVKFYRFDHNFVHKTLEKHLQPYSSWR